MTVGPAVALAVALLALGCPPLAMLAANQWRAGRAARTAGLPPVGWRPSRRQRRLLQRLDRMLAVTEPARIGADWSPCPHRPAIERIAADLRRLNRQRLGVASRSAMWHSAVLTAYDDQLRMASRCLGVVEYLDELDGVDLEIERLRVEGELQAAGLHLAGATAPPRRRHP